MLGKSHLIVPFAVGVAMFMTQLGMDEKEVWGGNGSSMEVHIFQNKFVTVIFLKAFKLHTSLKFLSLFPYMETAFELSSSGLFRSV